MPDLADLESETVRIGALLDAFAIPNADAMRTVACEDPEDGGAVPEMRVGNVDAEGGVGWRVLPSRLSAADVSTVEREFDLSLPLELKAYLLARTHLFDQVDSRKHGQLVLLCHTPFQAPLRPFRRALEAWRPITKAGYLPFAEWGDGWGPMCLDVGAAAAGADEAPVVWFDH